MTEKSQFYDKVKELEFKIEQINNKLAILEDNKDLMEILNKVHALDIKTENTNLRINYHDNRWNNIFDFLWKIILMVIAGYILYKLGISPPPG